MECVPKKPAASAFKYLQRMYTKAEKSKNKAKTILQEVERWNDAVEWEIDQRGIDLNTAWVMEAHRHWGSAEVAAAVKQLGMDVRPPGYRGRG